MARAPAFQAGYAGSIPVIRSMNEYSNYPNHPLCDVPDYILDVARNVMRKAVEWRDVDPDMAEPLADAIVIDLLPWLDLNRLK